jgi:hypothetical protein
MLAHKFTVPSAPPKPGQIPPVDRVWRSGLGLPGDDVLRHAGRLRGHFRHARRQRVFFRRFSGLGLVRSLRSFRLAILSRLSLFGFRRLRRRRGRFAFRRGGRRSF